MLLKSKFMPIIFLKNNLKNPREMKKIHAIKLYSLDLNVIFLRCNKFKDNRTKH
jgi:hypothetical protein